MALQMALLLIQRAFNGFNGSSKGHMLILTKKNKLTVDNSCRYKKYLEKRWKLVMYYLILSEIIMLSISIFCQLKDDLNVRENCGHNWRWSLTLRSPSGCGQQTKC